jgi:nucleoid DNA-binding protein
VGNYQQVRQQSGMKKTELARRLADQEAITTAAAADQLDELIFEILRRLKQGRAATFPGVGRIRPAGASQAKPNKAGAAK